MNHFIFSYVSSTKLDLIFISQYFVVYNVRKQGTDILFISTKTKSLTYGFKYQQSIHIFLEIGGLGKFSNKMFSFII